MPGDEADRGMDEEQSPSPVATLEQPRPHYQLGNDWSFGSGSGGGVPVTLPRSKKSVALALVVVLVAAAGAYFFLNRSKSGGGTALALTLTQGQTYGYQVSMSFNGNLKVGQQSAPINMQIGENFSWKVDSVDANGVAAVTMTVESITGTVNGVSQPPEGPLTIQIKVAEDGRILTAGNLAIAGSSSSGQAFPGCRCCPTIRSTRETPGRRTLTRTSPSATARSTTRRPTRTCATRTSVGSRPR
jgi:hypothetical protein